MKNIISGAGRTHAAENVSHNRLSEFNNLMNYFWNCVEPSATTAENLSSGELEPRMQIAETKDAVNITAELPGIDEKDLDLQISSDGYLSIGGEKKNSVETANKDAYFTEITYGSFKRTIPLPWDLDYDNAVAHYKHGVLCISIPKSPVEKQKFKKLEIKTTQN
ncbi:MAG: Hsp20/alpha crystallin family protein [Alphaproteobacteria bacterium]|nr:Hsp20/alpha crystallin family protein [Alphaproteobacteria bacterium]